MFLHVLNGDSTRAILEQTNVAGEMLVWADVLHDGPAPAALSADEWRQVRARHHASQGAGTEEEILAGLRERDERLERYADYEEVVFWLEHDLFDQLLLVRHLSWLAGISDRSRFRLISIGSFPGHPRFAGLGELSSDELASLFPQRQPLTEEQIALGSELWQAFGATDPRRLSDLVIDSNTHALPFVAGALKRHLEDFPSIENGLARSEQQILSAIGEEKRTATDVFLEASRLEERVFMGDSTFFTIMKRMTGGRAPLLSHEGTFQSRAAPTGVFSLTDVGNAVIDGRADYIELNGIDRWMGGVHLTDGSFRWTGARVKLTKKSALTPP